MGFKGVQIVPNIGTSTSDMKTSKINLQLDKVLDVFNQYQDRQRKQQAVKAQAGSIRDMYPNLTKDSATGKPYSDERVIAMQATMGDQMNIQKGIGGFFEDLSKETKAETLPTGVQGPTEQVPRYDPDLLASQKARLSGMIRAGVPAKDAFQSMGLMQRDFDPAKMGLSKELTGYLLQNPNVRSLQDFSNRPAGERSTLLREAQEDKQQNILEQSRSRGAGVEEMKIKMFPQSHVDGTALNFWRNPETLAKYPAGTTYGDLTKDKALYLSEKQVADVFDLENVDFIVEELDALTSELVTAPEWKSAIKQGVELNIEAYLKSNTRASAYLDTRDYALGVLARALGGEKGVLTDTDINRVIKALVNFRDTKDIRDLKMLSLKGLLNVAKESREAKIFGRKTVAGLRATSHQIARAFETGDANEIKKAMAKLEGLEGTEPRDGGASSVQDFIDKYK